LKNKNLSHLKTWGFILPYIRFMTGFVWVFRLFIEKHDLSFDFKLSIGIFESLKVSLKSKLSK